MVDEIKRRGFVRSRVVCAKCGSRGNKIDVRPNWNEQLDAANGAAL